MPNPIKRHIALQPISREHHHGLLLSWKIRQGISLGIASDRIKKYADWFWNNNLKPHFAFEEKYMFPILGNGNKYVKRALHKHGRLKSLFDTTENIEYNLSLLEKEITAHIRFEERILFKELERVATEDQLSAIERNHSKNLVDEWQDAFWISA